MPAARRPALVLLALAWLSLTGCLRLGGALFEAPDDSWTALHEAAAAGDLAGVQAALAAGLSPDARTAGKDTPLLLACRAGAGPVVEALLAAGAHPTGTNRREATPAVVAVAYGHASLLAPLVAAGSRLDAGPLGGIDTLRVAVLAGREEVLKELLRVDPEVVRRRAADPTEAWILRALAAASSEGVRARLRLGGLAPAEGEPDDGARKQLRLVLAQALLLGDPRLAGAITDLGVSCDWVGQDKEQRTLLHVLAAPFPPGAKVPQPAPDALDPIFARRRAAFGAVPMGRPARLAGLRFLLAHGADPRRVDSAGRTALDLAEAAGDAEAAAILRPATPGSARRR